MPSEAKLSELQSLPNVRLVVKPKLTDTMPEPDNLIAELLPDFTEDSDNQLLTHVTPERAAKMIAPRRQGPESLGLAYALCCECMRAGPNLKVRYRANLVASEALLIPVFEITSRRAADYEELGESIRERLVLIQAVANRFDVRVAPCTVGRMGTYYWIDMPTPFLAQRQRSTAIRHPVFGNM